MLNIKDIIISKDLFRRLLITIIGIFIVSLCYNLFLLPNNFVVGGISGLSIIFNKTWGWNAELVVYFGTFILLFIHIIVFKIKDSLTTIVGSVLYPVFITLTSGLAKSIAPYFVIDNVLILLIVAALMYGFGLGLVYRSGFNTGGSDVIVSILQKTLHISCSSGTFIVQFVIILMTAFFIGFNEFVYAIIILYIYTTCMEKVMIGSSTSKVFYVHSKKINKIKKFVIDELHTGVTLLKAEGGFLKLEENVLMCVVSNIDYYLFKESILEIDPNAFIVICDSYEVKGGVKNQLIPFI